MSFDWNNISEKVISFYREMEYHPEYNIERFKSDLEIEKKKKLDYTSQVRFGDMDLKRAWFLELRNVLEARRSILTKLFSLTNGLNNVDTLVESCDHVKSTYRICESDYFLRSRIQSVVTWYRNYFKAVTKNEVTKGVLQDVWNMLLDDTSYEGNKYEDAEDPCFGPSAMVIMADSDLNAVVQAFLASRTTYFEVKRILVQEPVKEKLLNILNSAGSNTEISTKFYVFRYTAEALGNLNGEDKYRSVSIWSENVIAAKKFAANAKTDLIWINAHGVIAPELSPLFAGIVAEPWTLSWPISTSKGNHSRITSRKTYDLFYGGKWHVPALGGEYFVNDAGDSFAQATEKDLLNCINSARGASKVWCSKKWSERLKIIRSFAARLRANGESERADAIPLYFEELLKFRHSLSVVRDGEAEITTISEPVGVVLIHCDDPKTLDVQLMVASAIGNAVIVLHDGQSTASFAPDCDLLASCGFPPGSINCLYAKNPLDLANKFQNNDTVLVTAGRPQIFAKAIDFYNLVTKLKSIWLQCG